MFPVVEDEWVAEVVVFGDVVVHQILGRGASEVETVVDFGIFVVALAS